MNGTPKSRASTLVRIKAALKAQGVEFIGDPITLPCLQLLRKPRLTLLARPYSPEFHGRAGAAFRLQQVHPMAVARNQLDVAVW